LWFSGIAGFLEPGASGGLAPGSFAMADQPLFFEFSTLTVVADQFVECGIRQHQLDPRPTDADHFLDLNGGQAVRHQDRQGVVLET
jgi:hypothetical protein